MTHIVSPLLLSTSTLKEIWESIKRGMAKHPHLPLPNDSNQDIWSYYKLLQKDPIVFDDHLVIILQEPLVDKPLAMNV